MLFEFTNSTSVDKRQFSLLDRIQLIVVRTFSLFPNEFRMVTYEDFVTSNVYRFLIYNYEYELVTI